MSCEGLLADRRARDPRESGVVADLDLLDGDRRLEHVPQPALKRQLARQADRLQALDELLGQHVVAQRLEVLLRRCLLEARQGVSDLVVVALAAARGERPRRGSGGQQGNGAAVQHRAEGTLRHMAPEPLVDGHGRLIGDLRVSVTDRCNFRCQYCMPAEGLPWLERSDILTFEEIARLVGLLSGWACATSGSRAASRSCAATSPARGHAARAPRAGRDRGDDQRLPARARRSRARRGRRGPLQRVGRLAPARPLLRDDASRRPPRRSCVASRRWPSSPRPIRSRSTPSRCAASPSTR